MSRIKLVTLFFVAFFIQTVFAQKNTITGTILDATAEKPLPLATVCIIGSQDSILRGFARANQLGQFRIVQVPDGKYLLKVSYPAGIDYTDTVQISGGKNHDAGTIKIINKVVAIREILINKYNNGLRINGDTTEYLADFFKTNPGATVEDLLKKLPGIQVNKNGEIIAQGQKVKKIMVDGEEFFPDDPTIATKYLRADMIDKVQVYDEKKDTLNTTSEEEKTKTMNLTLKDGKDKGLFGRLEAGSNFEDYTNAGAFAGYFNKKTKAAGFVKHSNFENPSLGWQDRNQYGGTATSGSNTQYSNGMMYSTQNASFNDDLDSRGIPNNTSVGLVFNHTVNKKFKVNSSYRFADEGLNGKISANSRYYLPDTSYGVLDTTQNKSKQQGHRLNLSFTLNPDSLNAIVFNNSLGYNVGKTSSNLSSYTSSTSRLNDNERRTEKNYTKYLYNGSLEWKKAFTKVGKSIRWNTDLTYNPTEQQKLLSSTSRFYDENGQIKNQQDLGQTTELTSGMLKSSTNATFANTITKKLTYSINYFFLYQKDNNTTNTYNTLIGQGELVDSLSNNFAFQQIRNTLGGTLNYKVKKTNYWISFSAGPAMFKQFDLETSTTKDNSFWNVSPGAGFNYSWKKQRNFSINYYGYNAAPSFTDLQPLVNNSDPLNIVVGNPNLVQSFNHGFNASVNSFQTLKGQYLWGFFNFNLPRNAFVRSTWIDSNATRTTMTVNANGNYSFNGNFNYNFRLFKSPVFMSTGITSYISKNVTFMNGAEVTTERRSVSGEVGLDVEEEKIEIGINYELSYNRNKTSSESQGSNYYLIHTPNYYFEIKLPAKFEIYSEGDFNIRPASNLFASRNVFYLSGGLRKKIGKKNDFELSAHINDILNQNIGFNRNIATNLVSEEIYTQLSRYWLFTVKWNFSSVGGGSDD